MLKRQVATMAKHQRLILTGYPGTGKSFLARRLAEFLVLKSGDELTAESVAVCWANKRSAQECSDFVASIGRGGGGGGSTGVGDNTRQARAACNFGSVKNEVQNEHY